MVLKLMQIKHTGTEVTREIPATPYMLHLLAILPRRNEWVFFSPPAQPAA